MKKYKKQQDQGPNFLTCPIPEPERPGVVNAAGIAPSRETREEKQKREKAETSIKQALVGAPYQSPLERAIPKVGTVPRRLARRSGPRIIPLIFFSCIIVVIVATAPAVYALVRVGVSAESAKQSIVRMQAELERRDIDGAERELDRATEELVIARDALRGLGFWRDAPFVGTQVRAMESAAMAGVETLNGVRGIFEIARDIFDIYASATELEGELAPGIEGSKSFLDLTKEEKQEILGRLHRSIPEMRIAQARIDVALETWKRIPQNDLILPLKLALQPIADALPRFKRAIDEAVPLMEVMIPLMGYPERSTYLIVLQNTDEIRPTGGFLGTVGLLDVDQGEIETFAFDDVYNLDNPASGSWHETPPEPMRRYLKVPAWFFRDANWSPDYPTSAATLLDFYVRERAIGTGVRPETPDGIIALNPPFFADLLRLVGPITIDGISFDAASYFDILEYEVEVGFLEKGIPRDKRKELVSKLGDELLNRLMKLPASRWPELLDIMTRSLERKVMMIYSADPELLSKLDAFGWTGRMESPEGDFLMVVDANLAALKTDGVMDKRVTYELDANNPNDLIATVTLHYRNDAPGFTEFKYTRYRDYVRVYVPEGSELIEVKGAMKDDRVFGGRAEVYKELGKTVFAAFWSIEPQKTQDLVFKYRLPASIREAVRNGRYDLLWQKQSGNDNAVLTISHAFDKNLRSANPAEDEGEFGDRRYLNETTSLTDEAFHIEF